MMHSTMSLCKGTPVRSSNAMRAQRTAVVTRATSDPLIQKPLAKPAAPTPTPTAQEPAAAAATSAASGSGVTIEYQRKQAKAMQQYFRDLKVQEVTMDAQVFGWTKKNEIGNGRWVMMGLAIGLLTEYATAVNFIDQLKLMVSYLGIADLQD